MKSFNVRKKILLVAKRIASVQNVECKHKACDRKLEDQVTTAFVFSINSLCLFKHLLMLSIVA